MGFPNEQELNRALKALEKVEASRVIDLKNASAIDIVKYEMCGAFVDYLNSNGISQADLARELDIDRARVNKIVKYRIEHFTIDKLFELLSVIRPDSKIAVS